MSNDLSVVCESLNAIVFHHHEWITLILLLWIRIFLESRFSSLELNTWLKNIYDTKVLTRKAYCYICDYFVILCFLFSLARLSIGVYTLCICKPLQFSSFYYYYYYYFLIKQRHVRLNLWSRRGDLGCRGRWHWELGHSLGVTGWEKGKQDIVTPNGHKDSDPKKYGEYGTLASTWKWLSAQLALVCSFY